MVHYKGADRKFSRRGGANGKIPKVSKKYRKIALFSFFHGGATEKRPKNSCFKPLLTIFVPCLKIQGGGTWPSPAPRCRRPWSSIEIFEEIF